MRRTILVTVPLVATLAGLAFGLLGDRIAGGVDLTLDRVLAAVVFSLVSVTFGGGCVDAPGLTVFFLMAGMLFWPVYAGLIWRWARTRKAWVGAVIFLWSCQGFFQLVHRFDGIMSV